MKKVAFEQLINEKENKLKSKLKNLEYSKLDIQEYFKTDKIPTKRKITLFKARTRMLSVAKNHGQTNQCPLCKMKDDDQKHLLECPLIKVDSPDILNNTESEYKDIFSTDIHKLSKISQLLDIAITKRKTLRSTKTE